MDRMAADEKAGNGKSGHDLVVRRDAQVQNPAAEEGSRAPESFGRAQPPPHKPPLLRRPWFWALAALIIIGGTVGGVLWWLHSRNYVSTDDAFIAAHVTSISPRVAGHVTAVHVNDNQDVKQNQLLVELDPTDYQQALESAQAQEQVARGQLESARSQVNWAQASSAQAQADITSAQANQTQAQEDLKRYQGADRRAVSQQQIDAAVAAARSTTAALESARQKLAAAEAQIVVARTQVTTAQAQVQRAQVAVQQAQTQLGYTKVLAPQDGRITNRSVSQGDYVQTGQALMALVPTSRYVVANFKETELRDMRPQQPVEIKIDAYGKTLKGHVQSIQSGSGAAFSLLPPENATGNYVKVVQRVPVKIVFDESIPPDLGPGMSVVPTVDISKH
jgi:membrane fusion protein, multidrug efflux system